MIHFQSKEVLQTQKKIIFYSTSLWVGFMFSFVLIYFDLFQTFLDESGFNFVTRCFQTLENRGLEDQGLYRVVGVSSKVTKLLSAGLDKKRLGINIFEKSRINKTVLKPTSGFFKPIKRNN